MNSVITQNFRAELCRIEAKLTESVSWPSPGTGLAFHILQLCDGVNPQPDSIKIPFPEGPLDTAPLIAAAGYSMCATTPNPEQSGRWQRAMERIAKREPFPRDRQTFAFRPAELVGIALGICKANLGGSASALWFRWVVETLPTKNPTQDVWALLLYHYAAALVGVTWPSHLPSRIADYELSELSLLLVLLTQKSILVPTEIANRKLTAEILHRAVGFSRDARESEKLAALLCGISLGLRSEVEHSDAMEPRPTHQPGQMTGEETEASPKPQTSKTHPSRPLVVVVHGIRTSGKWFRRLQPVLQRQADCVVEPAGFGFFNVFRFLLPGPTRKTAIEIVKRKLIHAIDRHKGRPLVIVSHSFGTYCVTNILKDNPQIRPSRLLFCGSIVDQEFHWHSLSQMAPEWGMTVVNDCGARDIWPPLAHSMTFGYGSSGSGGFQFPGVVDRWHDFGHSGFFTKEFVEEFWVPFVRDGTIAHSKYEDDMPETPWWISVIGLRPLLPWIAWFGLALLSLVIVFLIQATTPAAGDASAGVPKVANLAPEVKPPEIPELKPTLRIDPLRTSVRCLDGGKGDRTACERYGIPDDVIKQLLFGNRTSSDSDENQMRFEKQYFKGLMLPCYRAINALQRHRGVSENVDPDMVYQVTKDFRSKQEFIKRQLMPQTSSEWQWIETELPEESLALRTFMTDWIGCPDPFFSLTLTNETSRRVTVSKYTVEAEPQGIKKALLAGKGDEARYVMLIENGKNDYTFSPPIVVEARSYVTVKLLVKLKNEQPGAEYKIGLKLRGDEGNILAELPDFSVTFFAGKLDDE